MSTMAFVTLSPAQISQFHTEGFLVLRADEHNLIDLSLLQKWTAEVRDWPRGKGTSMSYEEVNIHGERQLMRTEHFVDDHGGFRDLLCGSEMAAILKQISNDVGRALTPLSLLSTPSSVAPVVLTFHMRPGHAALQ